MKMPAKKKKKVRTKLFDSQGLKAFAVHLKKVRTEQKFTQEELSHQSGIALSQVARIETARINPTLSTIFQIARTLKVPPARLFEFELPAGPKIKA